MTKSEELRDELAERFWNDEVDFVVREEVDETVFTIRKSEPLALVKW